MPYTPLPPTPQFGENWVSMGESIVSNLSQIISDMKTVFTAIETLQANPGTGGGGEPSIPGRVYVSTQGSTGEWSLTAAQAKTIHDAKGVIEWFVDASVGTWPTPTTGLANGDIVNGVMVSNVREVSITSAQVPVQVEGPGTASDRITLKKVTDVTWTVDGTDYPSSAFTADTRDVPFTKGGTCVVTAKASSPSVVVGGVAVRWTFTFNTENAGAVITSDTFSSGAKTLPLGDNVYKTGAQLGGTQKDVEVQGASSVITSAGTLAITPNSTTVVKGISVEAAASMKVVSAGGGWWNAKLSAWSGPTVEISLTGTDIQLVGHDPSGTYWTGGKVAYQIGDTVTVGRKGRDCFARVHRGGALVGEQKWQISAAFSPNELRLVAPFATGDWQIDDLKIVTT